MNRDGGGTFPKRRRPDSNPLEEAASENQAARLALDLPGHNWLESKILGTGGPNNAKRKTITAGSESKSSGSEATDNSPNSERSTASDASCDQSTPKDSNQSV